MKKYLFGLGAMLIGAGLMFVFTHTDVSAESEADFDFICKEKKTGRWDKDGFVPYGRNFYECKKGNTICYSNPYGLSCFNTGLFK